MQASPDDSRRALERRDLVDHTLERNAALAAIRSGLTTHAEACDAHPHLLLAARHYGQPTEYTCPVCGAAQVRIVHFGYGDSLGDSAGQARIPRDFEQLAEVTAQFQVYDVEVCSGCRWNHLLRSYVLGRADLPQPRPKRARSDRSRAAHGKDRTSL